MYSYIVIDGTNFFHRCFAASKKTHIKFPDSKVLYTGAITFAFERIKYLRKKFAYDNSTWFFFFDYFNSAINIRKFLSNGEYKHARERNKNFDRMFKYLDLFTLILKVYDDNFYIAKLDNMEADDLTAPIARFIKASNFKKALYISSDMDWARNMDNHSDWFDWNTVYNKMIFKNKYGFVPSNKSITMYKAIHGDISDSIENAVPNLPKKILMDLANNCQSVDEILPYMENNNHPKKWLNKVHDNYEKIVRNYILVDFMPIGKDAEDILYKCKRDKDECSLFFKALNLPLEFWMINKKNPFEKK